MYSVSISIEHNINLMNFQIFALEYENRFSSTLNPSFHKSYLIFSPDSVWGIHLNKPYWRYRNHTCMIFTIYTKCICIKVASKKKRENISSTNHNIKTRDLFQNLYMHNLSMLIWYIYLHYVKLTDY